MTPNSHQVLLDRIERLNAIGTALSAEEEFSRLLEMILMGAKELTNADGGSLYIIAEDLLLFELIHTTSLKLHMGGSSDQPITFPPIPLYNEDGSPRTEMVVTRAANECRLFNIPDAYEASEFDFSGTREFDTRTGYRSTSFLTVPMQDHENQVIGVLQLINAIDPDTGDIRPFSDEDESLVASLASQAAVALTRKGLIDGLEELLQSLVKLIANAIDDKSPHTGGHCRRVPPITMGLAQAVNDDDSELFGDVCFSDKELEELEMAAWLHDCGKITTPEYVVDKHTRLETIFDRIELVNTRLEILRRDAEIARLKTRLAQQEQQSAPGTTLDADLNEIQEFITNCNSAGFIDEEKKQRIAELAKLSYRAENEEEPKPLLTENEVYNLSISKGTLTDEERTVINNHIVATIRMLEPLPFPKHLHRVPEIAGGHHERMDGKGYPNGIPASELTLQARILAVADVFEALTASDRGYRKPNTLSEALKIMGFMCKEGHIDPELLEVFIRKEAYLDYARESLKPGQIDEVDIEQTLAVFMG